MSYVSWSWFYIPLWMTLCFLCMEYFFSKRKRCKKMILKVYRCFFLPESHIHLFTFIQAFVYIKYGWMLLSHLLMHQHSILLSNACKHIEKTKKINLSYVQPSIQFLRRLQVIWYYNRIMFNLQNDYYAKWKIFSMSLMKLIPS